MTWKETAFSHTHITNFLSVVALPHYEAKALMPFASVVYQCFCTGFYFFIWGIQKELTAAMAEDLLNLAVRIEASVRHPSASLWNQNAEEAKRILACYFNDGTEAAQ